MRDGLFVALHLVAVVLHLVSAVLLLLVRRDARASTPNTGRSGLPGGLSTQREEVQRLLVADDVGLGKTASALTGFSDTRILPAVVVTLTHLPRQWQRELARFLPRLRVHVAKRATPEDVTRGRFSVPPGPGARRHVAQHPRRLLPAGIEGTVSSWPGQGRRASDGTWWARPLAWPGSACCEVMVGTAGFEDCECSPEKGRVFAKLERQRYS